MAQTNATSDPIETGRTETGRALRCSATTEVHGRTYCCVHHAGHLDWHQAAAGLQWTSEAQHKLKIDTEQELALWSDTFTTTLNRAPPGLDSEDVLKICTALADAAVLILRERMHDAEA